MNLLDFMSAIYQILLDKIKDQGFSVLLLIIAIIFFWTQQEKTEITLNAKISNVETSLIECNKSRFDLSIAVKELETKFSLLHPEKKR